jgi:dihydrofolate reductase
MAANAELDAAGQSPASTGGEGRRLVVSMFVTLDGYIVGPDEDVSWVTESLDPEWHDDVVTSMSQDVDVYVLGRVTYDIFAAYWPHAEAYEPGDDRTVAEGKEDPRIIKALNDLPKVVFSTTLDRPEWHNTRVVAGGVEDEVRRLKQESGKHIAVQGSASIVQALARADLVDEYWLYLHPVLLGAGTLLFDTATGELLRQRFETTQVKRYANGVVALRYARQDGGR